MTPHVISSLDTLTFIVKHLGNTAVCRKSVSGHNVITEATKATRVILTKHMEDIAESGRDLEGKCKKDQTILVSLAMVLAVL